MTGIIIQTPVTKKSLSAEIKRIHIVKNVIKKMDLKHQGMRHQMRRVIQHKRRRVLRPVRPLRSLRGCHFRTLCSGTGPSEHGSCARPKHRLLLFPCGRWRRGPCRQFSYFRLEACGKRYRTCIDRFGQDVPVLFAPGRKLKWDQPGRQIPPARKYPADGRPDQSDQ